MSRKVSADLVDVSKKGCREAVRVAEQILKELDKNERRKRGITRTRENNGKETLIFISCKNRVFTVEATKQTTLSVKLKARKKPSAGKNVADLAACLAKDGALLSLLSQTF